MTDSTPDISPLLSPMKQDRKVKLPDQSLILQGKRSRKQAEQFVAKSIESKSSEENETADAFSKHLLKQAEKQKGVTFNNPNYLQIGSTKLIFYHNIHFTKTGQQENV